MRFPSLLLALLITISLQAQKVTKYQFSASNAKQGATVSKVKGQSILDLGSSDGYYDLTLEAGQLISSMHDLSVSVYFRIDPSNQLDGYGHFLLAFSELAENKQDDGPYFAFRLNEQRFETSTGGWNHEQAVMQGGKAKRGQWVHALFRQKGHQGQLFLDGQLIATNDQMPILAETFHAAPAHCWIGKAPFHGDKYLANTQVADLRIYSYSVSDSEIKKLQKKTPKK